MDVTYSTTLLLNNCAVYDNSSDYEDLEFDNPFDRTDLRVLFFCIYILVFGLCLFGNSMVLFAIVRSPRLRSMTNFLLANLAFADFCVGAFCVLPNLSTFLQPNWILGRVMCKIYYYIWNVSYIASITILTVIAIERYIAILHPLKARHFMTNCRLIAVQIVIWLIALLYNIPFLVFYDTISFSEDSKAFCYASFEHVESLKWLSLANIIVWYGMPLLLIGFIYYRVARALWKTTITSALRLQPYPDIEEESVKSSSFRMTNYNLNSMRNNSVRAKSQMKNGEAVNEGSQGNSSSSENSKYGEKAVFTFKGKHTITVMCGDRECQSPREGTCFFPVQATPSSSDGNEHDCSHRQCKCRIDRENSISSYRNSFRQSRYRQTCLSSSRRVAKARKKVIRLLICVVICFAICVLPHMMKVLNHYWVIFDLPHSVNTIMSPISFIVLYLNSVLNPFLYAMFSTNFRRSFKEALPCFGKRRAAT